MNKLYSQLMDLYYQLKIDIRHADRHLYEQWKAGGFLIDDDVISMYPTLGKLVEDLTEGEAEEGGEHEEAD